MKKVADKNELLHVLDENGNETNKLEYREIVHEKGLWHNEVACVVINKKKQVLLQKRGGRRSLILIVGLCVLGTLLRMKI